MTEIKHESELNTLLTGVTDYCDKAVEAGNNQMIRELSRELVCCLNRANRQMLATKENKHE